MKKHFWKLEYSITLFALFGLLLVFVPFNFENYLQAQMTNSWIKQYGRLSYLFSAIKAEEFENPTAQFDIAYSKNQERKALKEIVEPYLKLNSVARKTVDKYKPSFLNGVKVPLEDDYFFNNFYFSNRGTFLGIKRTAKYKDKKSTFMVMIDVNGILPPNVWGKDIYGIDVYGNGEIRPFGHKQSLEVLEKDCSKNGTGVYCSALYLIGGEMNE